jgi:tetratricopeptide (TPR) repeat protein
MANEPITASTANQSLPAAQVYAMAVVCLVAGLGIGYLLQGLPSRVAPAPLSANAASASTPAGAMGLRPATGVEETKQAAAVQAQPAAHAGLASPHLSTMNGGQLSSLEEMSRIADKEAAPLLEKLKSNPKDSAALLQLGAIYHTVHQFKQAAVYYGRAVEIDPKNLSIRAKLASSLYRDGDVDGAIEQLNRSLRYDPSDANSLFDLGLIRLQGKQDGKGALAAWQQLLKSNPQLSPERKATVEKLMANVLTTLGDQNGVQGARSNDGHKSKSN